MARVGAFGFGAFALALLAASSPAGAISIQAHTSVADADFVVGGGLRDLVPTSMAAGFYNGDNRSDLVVCSFENNTCWLFYGSSIVGGARVLSAPDITFVGPNGAFGSSASFIGDVNGDGLADLAIGAPNATGVGGVLGGGSLWIFFGRNDGFQGQIGYYDANSTVFGLSTGDSLGFSASPAGDVDRDGYGDFWVGAPDRNEGGVRVGAALLFRGRAVWPTELNESGAALLIAGVANGGGFGRILLGNVDLNNDSRMDLLTSTAKYRDRSGTQVGAAFAFVGPLPTDGRTTNASRANITFWGNTLVPTLGASVAFAPEFMKEAGRIVLVGAPVYANNTSTGGSVYLFRVSNLLCCQNYNTWDAAGLIYTREANDQAGLYLAAGGDIDHDGIGDLIIGAPNGKVGSLVEAGRAFVIYGNDTSRQPVLIDNKTEGLDGRSSRSYLANIVLFADFNGDGWADIIVGSPGDPVSASQGGAVYGFIGRPRNRPPEANLAAFGNMTEGSPISVHLNVSDPDKDRLTWLWVGTPDGKTYDNAGDVVLVYPNQGTFVVSVTVFDGTLFTTVSIQLVLANLPPMCNLTLGGPFVEGEIGMVRVSVHDPGSRDTWRVDWRGPPGMSFANNTGVYRPQRGDDFTVNATATDSDGGVGSCETNIDVVNVAPTVALVGPTLITEGDTALYTVSVQDPGAEDAFFYNWSSPDAVGNGTAFIFSPVRPGRYTIQVRVTDLDGGNSWANGSVNVLNIDPDVLLVMPPGAVEGEPIEFHIKQYSGQSYDPLTVSWNVPMGGVADGLYYRIFAALPGVYNFTVNVFDDDNVHKEFPQSFVVSNRAPLANVKMTPLPPHSEGQVVTFEAVLGPWESTPPSEMSYTWFLDGDDIGTTRTLRLTMPVGTHKVGVRAVDRDGGISWLNRTVSGENQVPTVRITGDDELAPGALGVWHAEASDSSGKPVQLTWDVDGQQLAAGIELKWSSKAPGTHVVRVTADDGSGGLTSATMIVNVKPPDSTSAGIDIRWLAVPLGAAAAFAAGILLGAYVVGRIRERRRRE